jgi:hypothetical protein
VSSWFKKTEKLAQPEQKVNRNDTPTYKETPVVGQAVNERAEGIKQQVEKVQQAQQKQQAQQEQQVQKGSKGGRYRGSVGADVTPSYLGRSRQ